MADPTPEKDAEIQEILTDLDNILSDLSGGDAAGAEKIAQVASTPKPVPQPAPPSAPPPVAQPAPQPAPAANLEIELSPREGTLPGKKKEAAPAAAKPKPALAAHPPLEIKLGGAAPATPPPEAAPAAAPAPAPAATAPPAAGAVPVPAQPIKQAKSAPAPAAPHSEAPLMVPAAGSIPAATPKDQIRRVCFVHSEPSKEQCDNFIAFLDQSALTISKKPLYLRKVLTEAFGPQGDAPGLVKRAQAAKAVAVLAVLGGIPESKAQELAEACSGAGLSFRVVDDSEVQKRSVAVDIMVDMMLLPGEE